MPVVKTYDISTVDKVKEITKKVRELQELRMYDDYTEDDIMIVRTTNIFPTNRIIKPLAEASVIEKNKYSFLCNSLRYQIDEDALKELEIYNLCHRTTSHMTENGLVLSHPYGNFDNRAFIILDALSEQLNKADFRSFSGQDIFVKGNMTLSDKAIIIIKADYYEALLESYPELENFNVVLYIGIPYEDKKAYEEDPNNSLAAFDINDERAIVEQVLMDLGYTPELIGQSYIINSPTSEKIRDLNTRLAAERGVLCNLLHCYTPEYKSDIDDRDKISDIFDNLFLDFIAKNYNLDKSTLLNKKGLIDSDTSYKLINIIGIEGLKSMVSSFNLTIEKMQKQSMLPSSNELLKGNIPDIYQAYMNINLQEADTRK